MADTEIRIDLSNITIGEFRKMLAAQRDGDPIMVLDFLNKLVVGGCDNMPLTALLAIQQRVLEEMRALATPKN